ncbi:hypothetical protein PAAG_11057 [Paracoccidioides lutzii Pb01]|uniref:arginine--tRNA ligase n=1 Tax=Paracoccidioides lutzii (strain ATCC MYA-826 / Pb01) TaxID=502779 RepID=A0A0A2V3Q6_PARBA|nr:hypothetical protein PAAG_11057 [Paracoccidioides lutzii Pb01]KGQ02108.1 hypothetical protein PAAG_11057 [Paracoccidioides lutzii Pb01]
MRQHIYSSALFIPKCISQQQLNLVLKPNRLSLQLQQPQFLKRCPFSFFCTPRTTTPSPSKHHRYYRAAMATDSVPSVAELSIHSTTNEVSQYPNCYPSVNPVDRYRAHIAELVAEALGVDSQAVYPRLQWTNSLDKGDLVLAAPALQIKGKKPPEVVAQILENLAPSDLINTPIAVGTHIQFFFKPEPLTKTVIKAIQENRATYGSNANVGLRDPTDPSKGKKKIIVEFSSPNIAKPFHAGHLRSTIIGGFLANLYTIMGWDVVKMNYLGDWGKQYGLLANGYEKYGNEEELVKDPINHLFDVYVKINKDVAEQEGPIKELREQIKARKEKDKDITELEKELQAKIDASYDEMARRYFKSMEDGDEKALALWRRFRDLSIEKYKETYARLNIGFDCYSGESQVKSESLAKAYEAMEKTGVSENSEGAVIVDFAKHGAKKLGKAIVIRKDVTELVGRKDLADRCQHVNFGMVRGMSTRKGTVKFLNDILKDVGEKMHEVMKKNAAKYEQVEEPEKTADILGITSVMVQDMSGKRINGYEFNLDVMTSFEGDTGPYLQYAHARLCSMTRKADVDPSELTTANLSLLTEPHAIDLIRLLAVWPDVVFNTTKTLEPTTILTYLFRMTHVLSSGYDVLKVVGSEPEVKKARMAMYDCARQVLSNGMRLLGLNPVDR